MTTEAPAQHQVVSLSEWIAAGKDLLQKEKEFTRARDALSAARRDLPWVKVESDYVFEGPDGPVSLSELFDGRSQLIVYHYMYAPGWDEGCIGCSFVCDHVDSARQHFEHHDVAYVAVSRAPLAEFQEFKKRMGWSFRWVSSAKNSFNYDYGVSYRKEELEKGPVLHNFTMQKLSGEEQPGLSVFTKDADGNIYRTYSSYERGLDLLIGAYNYLDLTPKGRNETGPMSWLNFHDRYED
ncbi:DUF899 domain-containing protein [Fimbriimonas ginsengisoli]|uniref:DUF899 domain-containing protein n=1 Tax=Fimbriimonas ginsengisoli Gsoil 348 TaxID=661478 RepID=A0A068NLM7_FIMGI|nr:thioredoxin family protein [Fimbriimonas ginsengisoli]AIE84463.1 hypothetical protein OP10G_1095 [Fimbriimonas ginsengisoli Gsoil 348]